ncbi:MAG: hypothetical protein IT483_11430 [Gammaproteobacteria bacterium]|nr:hypothetical protein [Gammaproteobacteria bacterium]
MVSGYAQWLLTGWLAWTGLAVAEEQPHWRDDRCDACHTTPGPAVGAAPLKASLADEGCAECHDGSTAGGCGHRSPLTAPEAMVSQMPSTQAAAMAGGKVGCVTCHDLKQQCLAEHREGRAANPAFLRDGPYRDVSEQCYGCHTRSAQRKLNPHRQVSAGAGVIKESCLLCHPATPSTAPDSSPKPGFHLASDLNAVCAGCHPVAPHPGFNNRPAKRGPRWTHLVKPSPQMLEFMRARSTATGLQLPLEPGTDRIVCSTCHNPHATDLPGYPAGGEAGTGDYKLRASNICSACHEI